MLLVLSSNGGFYRHQNQWVMQHFLTPCAHLGQSLLIKQLCSGCNPQLTGSQSSHQRQTLTLIFSHESHIMKKDAIKKRVFIV